MARYVYSVRTVLLNTYLHAESENGIKHSIIGLVPISTSKYYTPTDGIVLRSWHAGRLTRNCLQQMFG